MKLEIKFRVWNGETMISPDYIDRIGFAHWRENSIPEASDNVMQYTGLKDKNGKEIYDGDVIRYIDNPTNISTGDYRVIIDTGFIGIDAATSLHLSDIEPHVWCEVIGNIYEHSHLLTQN